MGQLMEVGAHYGHRKNLWNPKMLEYIYGTQCKIHIIDLQQTVRLLDNALNALMEVASQNGRTLFVATKRQATKSIEEEAQRCGQYYVSRRWLGGTLTNWPTVSASIKKLDKYNKILEDETSVLTKKEQVVLERKRNNLERVLGGIKNMGGLPDILFVVDVNENVCAIREAQKLKIPIVGIVDTNSDPEGITYTVPANDDSRDAIALYCRLASEAVLLGLQRSMERSGVDVGALANTEVLAQSTEISTEENALEKGRPSNTNNTDTEVKELTNRKKKVRAASHSIITT